MVAAGMIEHERNTIHIFWYIPYAQAPKKTIAATGVEMAPTGAAMAPPWEVITVGAITTVIPAAALAIAIAACL